jgi:glycosyltransferase involved in cell wall biosynthesis/SAM-dependent methyltransferase
VLLVIVPDYVSAILAKGEYQPRYYNPGEVFDEVHLLMTNVDRPDVGALQYTVGRARLQLHNVPEPPQMHLANWGANDRQLLKEWAAPAVALAHKIRPSLIRCHGADMNIYAAMRIKQTLGIPYVASLHINADVNATRRFLGKDLTLEQQKVNALFNYIEREGLRAADLVMPVYQPILPYLERLGVERVDVCYNVLNGEDLRHKEDFELHAPVRVVGVGRQFEDKNPENIIRALARLPGVEYTLIGDGPMHEPLRALAHECGVADRVIFLPAVPNPELCRSLPSYDIFAIHTEYWELNKSVLEALLTGLPVVINKRQGLPVPELEGDFVLKVENTVEAYEQALTKLIGDAAFRESLGRKAYEHSRRKWEPAVTEKKFADIYRRITRLQLPPVEKHTSGATRLDLGFFRCPSCLTHLPRVDEAITCGACGAVYPLKGRIPILVRNWTSLANEIARAQALRPDWYVEEQPLETVSPWRHHLRKRRRYVEGVLEKHLRANGLGRAPRLLDLGCGDGTNLAWLQRFAEQIYGSDYNLLRLARSQVRVPNAVLFLANLLDYPVLDDYFDLIFFNHVIEHISDDVAALAQVARILKPGGLLVLGTPNEGAWWWQLAYRRAPQALATTDHVHFYTAKTIGQKVAECGLDVRHIEHMGWGPPDWALDMKLRSYKVLDDAFELVGRVFLQSQASSLYVLAQKAAGSGAISSKPVPQATRARRLSTE